MRKELKSEGGFPFGLRFERVQNHGGDNMEMELEVSVHLLSTAKKQSNERWYSPGFFVFRFIPFRTTALGMVPHSGWVFFFSVKPL